VLYKDEQKISSRVVHGGDVRIELLMMIMIMLVSFSRRGGYTIAKRVEHPARIEIV
jgi:hypothetical protein